MNSRLGTMRTRVVVAAVAAFTLVGVAAFPQIARAAGTVTVSSPSVTEGHTGTSPVVVTFTLSPATHSETVTVAYSTQPGTATEADYVKQNGTVTFAPNDASEQVTFFARGDQSDEANETFKVQIDSVTGGDYAAGNPNFGTVTILDDDQTPTPSVNDTFVTEGTGGTNALNFTVRLSAPAGSTTTFFTFTGDPRDPEPNNPLVDPPRPATEGVDYTSADGRTVVFAPGETTKTVAVAVATDTTDEHDEYVELRIKSTNDPGAGELDFATGKIVDDDALARLDVADPEPVVEGDTPCDGVGQEDCDNMMFFTVTLTPASGKRVVVDYATSNRSATAGSDYSARSGAGDPEDPAHNPADTPGLVFEPGETSKTVEVPIRGDNTAEPHERFAFDLSEPINAELGDAQAFGLIIDDDNGSFPSVRVSDSPDKAENAGPSSFVITVTRPSPTNSANVRVYYTTADGPEAPSNGAKAVAGSDYTATSGFVDINFPQTTATVEVPLIDDTRSETEEFFQLQLTDASNASITDAVGVAKITDNDAPPTVSIADKTVTEGTGETPTQAAMTVTLSTASGQTVSVDCTTPQPNSGTATAGDDYTSTSSRVEFAPGETSKTCVIPVVADSRDEDNETVAVTLSNPSGATISDGAAVLTITDDDNPPTISIGSAPVTEGSSTNSTATLPVSLSGASSRPVTVNVATANGTATAPADYTSKTETLTFNPGEVTKDFKVTVIADTLDEADETFTGTLSAPTNATLGSPTTGTATIQDDDGGTTPPPTGGRNITTGPGPGGGPHIKVFNPNGTGPTVGFMDGGETAGKRVARGDLDGDGRDEIITGSGPNSAAIVSAYSSTGQLIASSFAYADGKFFGGIFVGAGDVDGDGKDEIVTGPGAGGGPHIRVWKLSGQSLTGSSGFMAYAGHFTGGVTVAAGDTDGDGKADVITGPGAGGGPHVRAFSGANGAELYGVMAYEPNFTGGVTVAAGDLDGDGRAEVATGVGPGGGPHLRLFNNNLTLRNGGIYALSPNFTGGINVAIGDLVGDGNAEILAGAMTQATSVRGFNADLSSMPGTTFDAYPGFGGGVSVGIGKV